MYTAYYAPKGDSRSQSGFLTEDEAWDWVHKNGMCQSCMDELARSKEPDYDGHGIWACEAEWFVLKTEDFDKAESFGDILTGAGYKPVTPAELKAEDFGEN